MSTSWHEVEVSEYKGNPTLTIPVGFNGSMTFGFNKAVLLSLYMDEIHAFFASKGKQGSPNVVISEYKGNPLIELPTNKPKFPFKFGVTKAGAILECLDHIDKFVNENDKSIPDSETPEPVEPDTEGDSIADKGLSDLVEASDSLMHETEPEYEHDVFD